MKLRSIQALSLRRNFSHMLIGNATYSLSQWGILISLAKLSSTEAVGVYTLGIAVTAPIILLTDLQLRTILATDAKKDYSFENYLSLRVFMSMIAFLIIIFLLLMGGYDSHVSLIILLMGMTKIIETYCEIHYGFFQKHERMDLISRSLIIRGLLSFLSVSFCIWVLDSLVSAVIGIGLSWLFVYLIVDRPSLVAFRQNTKIRYDKGLKKLLITAFPLGIVMMLSSLTTNIPRYFIEHYAGLEQLAYFSALIYILFAGNIVINAFGQSASPRLASFYINGDFKKFLRLVFMLLSIGLFCGVIGYVIASIWGKQLLTIIYSSEYAAYQSVFTLLMFASILLYTSSFLGYILTSMRKFKIQPFLSLFWIVITIAVSALLIPKFGINGAAYVTIATAAAQCLSLATVIIYEVSKAQKATSIRYLQKRNIGGDVSG
ncbi:lipopolysaccharide biosynthesis protein [Bacillus sp. OK048]|uniref:lipopolysaccharide biosynthesis protein n=1 Tax=Bacillus sp. OK048 TaxID=1882761 RepID=UPI00088A1907|nr:oligosaccharide flippase family protein [Bacillus sp. OK048]SDN56909.1 Membrane protein involved in the export of O-antigen and teichoic acid [Bacillus sp. OK048]